MVAKRTIYGRTLGWLVDSCHGSHRATVFQQHCEHVSVIRSWQIFWCASRPASACRSRSRHLGKFAWGSNLALVFEAVQSRPSTTFPESWHDYWKQYFRSFGRGICLPDSPNWRYRQNYVVNKWPVWMREAFLGRISASPEATDGWHCWQNIADLVLTPLTSSIPSAPRLNYTGTLSSHEQYQCGITCTVISLPARPWTVVKVCCLSLNSLLRAVSPSAWYPSGSVPITDPDPDPDLSIVINAGRTTRFYARSNPGCSLTKLNRNWIPGPAPNLGSAWISGWQGHVGPETGLQDGGDRTWKFINKMTILA